MRFGAATFIWTSPFTSSDVGLVRTLSTLGFDLIEVAFEVPGITDPVLLQQELTTSGVEASVLAFCTPERDVSSANATVREAGLIYLRQAVDFACQIGATVVAGPIAHPPGRARFLPAAERHDERMRSIESLHAAGEHAAANGVSLAVEQMCRFDSDMFNVAADSVAFIEEVDHAAVGLLLDTFHMHIEEQSTGDAIRTVGKHLRHFHASENNRGIPGTGQVHWTEAATALNAVGYGGIVSIESFTPNEAELAGLVAMWRPWFDEPDVFARDGLAFVQETFN